MSITGTSLNPSDVATGGSTQAPVLTNGNLTVTGPAGGSNYCAIRSVAGAPQASGAAWFAATVDRLSNRSGVTTGVGLFLSTASLDQNGGSSGGFFWYCDGTTSVNGIAAATVASWTTGSKLVVAFIPPGSPGEGVWCQVNNGLWNNALNANPAWNVGGIDLSPLTGAALMPAFWSNPFGGSFSQITFDFSAPPGLPPTPPKTCQAWARAINFPSGGGSAIPGPWTNGGNPLSEGKPDLNAVTGGYSFLGDALPGEPVFLTAQGTGDSAVTLFSQPLFAPAPLGYFPGWPGLGGAGSFDSFDKTTAQGSAIGNVVPPRSVGFPASPGIVQGFAGVTFGAYYFEFAISGYDIFSEKTGIGIGRANPNIGDWFDGGGFSAADTNGGVFIDGGDITNSFKASIQTNTGPAISLPDFETPAGQAVGVAILMTTSFPPAVFDPQQLQPVPLVCVPCSELILPNSVFRNRFGR